MKITQTKLVDVKIIKHHHFRDERGVFVELWNERRFKKNIGNYSFVQENYSKSDRGVLRGLHYQIEHPQGKLIHLISGEVFDVAVDLRMSSPDFGKWTGVFLNSVNNNLMWIPPGFAHGFYVLSYQAELLYKCTDYYFPNLECCIKWNDSCISIKWPIMTTNRPILSLKDENGKAFHSAEVYE